MLRYKGSGLRYMNLGGGHNSTHGRDPPLPIHPEAARPSSPTGEVTFPAHPQERTPVSNQPIPVPWFQKAQPITGLPQEPIPGEQRHLRLPGGGRVQESQARERLCWGGPRLLGQGREPSPWREATVLVTDRMVSPQFCHLPFPLGPLTRRGCSFSWILTRTNPCQRRPCHIWSSSHPWVSYSHLCSLHK